MVFEQVFKILFTPVGMPNVVSNLKNIDNLQKDINKNVSNTTKQISKQTLSTNETKQALRGVSNVTSNLVNKFEDVTSKLESTNKLLENSGSIFSNLITRSKAFSSGFSKARGEGKGLFEALGTGADSFNMALGQGSKLVSANLANIGKVVAGILPKIAAIGGIIGGVVLAAVVAFKTLKRMFQLNVGGMASRWFKFIGTIRNQIGQFKAAFDKALIKLGPIFDTIFGFIETIATNALNEIIGLIKGIAAILKPIFEVFVEIEKAISEAFGGKGANDMKIFQKIGLVLGKTFEYIGKTIGVLLKIGLKPLIIIIRSIGFFLKILNLGVKTLVKTFLEFKPVQIVIKAISSLFESLKKSIEAFLNNPIIKKIIDFFVGKEKKEISVRETGGNVAARLVKQATISNNTNVRSSTTTFNNQIKMYSNSSNGAGDALQIESMLNRQQSLSKSI